MNIAVIKKIKQEKLMLHFNKNFNPIPVLSSS